MPNVHTIPSYCANSKSCTTEIILFKGHILLRLCGFIHINLHNFVLHCSDVDVRQFAHICLFDYTFPNNLLYVSISRSFTCHPVCEDGADITMMEIYSTCATLVLHTNTFKENFFRNIPLCPSSLCP